MEWDGTKTQILFFNPQQVALIGFGPLSAAPSSAISVGVFGQRLFEFRGGLRSLQAARASFAGRPR
jgi:hypothetical protein